MKHVAPPPTVRVHGLDFVDLSPDELETLLASLLKEECGVSVFTPNALIGYRALRDAPLRDLLRRADLLLPDGAGVLATSRRQTPHAPLRHRLPGIEAGETVLHLCAAHGYSVYFLGGKEGVAAEAVRRWQTRLPTLRVAGHHNGYFEKWGEESHRLCEQIEKAAPDVVFVCFGFPAQERWIEENRTSLPCVRLFMGLGGSLDVWAGHIRRAPRPFRRLHLEWLWRGLCQPRRLCDVPRLLRYVFAHDHGQNAQFDVSDSVEKPQSRQN